MGVPICILWSFLGQKHLQRHGDFIYGIENGADFILFGNGTGPCRLGYYGDLQAEILKSLDYKVEFVCLDLNKLTFKELLSVIKPLTKDKSVYCILKGIVLAIKSVFMVDKLNELARYTRCREFDKGETDKVMSMFHNKSQNLIGYKNMSILMRSTWKSLKKISINKKFIPLKVFIVGEIYVAAHPLINFEIEKKLGNMGVEVHSNLCISHWIADHFIKKMLPVKLKNKPHEAGKEFIHTDDAGGHCLHTIGCSVLSAKDNFDGVIHLYPFTCMPEIIAQSAFSEVQNKYDIPIMTLIIDEMTGEAGYITRLEAFIDMLKMRKVPAAEISATRVAHT